MYSPLQLALTTREERGLETPDLALLSEELEYRAREQLRCGIHGRMLLPGHDDHPVLWQSRMNRLYSCLEERRAIASQEQECRRCQAPEARRLEDVLI
jgi:hypothetical protein